MGLCQHLPLYYAPLAILLRDRWEGTRGDMGKRNRGRGRGNTNRRPNVATKQQATSVQQNNSIQQSPFTANQAFNPGIPLLPTPLFGPTPRLFPYTPGINIYQQPRIGERTSFDELRDLAVSYDAIQLCEQAWYDVWRGLEPRVVPGPHLLKEGQSEDDYLDDILKYEAMFEKPDGVTDILDLCQAALRDRLEIDAVAWYIHKTNDGDFYALELVDGATIKPLVDARGQRPSPPWPAYEQYLYGAPAGEYTADEMIYMRETHRSIASTASRASRTSSCASIWPSASRRVTWPASRMATCPQALSRCPVISWAGRPQTWRRTGKCGMPCTQAMTPSALRPAWDFPAPNSPSLTRTPSSLTSISSCSTWPAEVSGRRWLICRLPMT